MRQVQQKNLLTPTADESNPVVPFRLSSSEGISPEPLKRLQLFLIGLIIAGTLALFRLS